MTFFIELGALLVALFLLYLLVLFLKNPMHIILNSVFGIVIFMVLNLLGAGIPINLLSVGVVAVGGLTGLLLVLMLHVTGLGF
ncbi:pro-sigmaK processing inhibitor BofA family protein [Candidatus Micrarchaeota archaeon]|nr:pro-sigmaK processing inhibitor BofA family protein [Candidatus Micrarchaeota archaeon]